MWWTLCGWLFVAGLAGAAWHYQTDWKPWLERQAAAVSWLEPLLPRNKPPAAKTARVVPVSTAVVQRRDMPLYLNGLGTVTAFKTVTIRSRVEGELVSVTFDEGEFVDEGKVLAEIDPRPYEIQLAQAESQLAREQSVLKTAKLTLSRYEGLLVSKSISTQQVDEQATLVQQSMAGVQAYEAMIDNVKLQLKYCRIVAPISGRIGLRLVDQGNIVRANDPNGLAVINQLQPIALVFTVPQDDIADVKRRADEVKRRSGGKEALPVAAFDRDMKRNLATGELLAIDNQVDATTGTVRLKAVFKNEDGALFPNQFVNARLLVDTKRGAVVVPTAAVQRGPASMFVYVVTSDDTVEQRSVVPGPSEGAETSIESGLAPGETIVTDGLDKLQPGAKVAPRDTGKDVKAGNKEKNKGAADKDRATPPDSGPPDQTPKSKSAPSTDPDRPRTTADKTAADQTAADHTTSDQSKGRTTAADGPVSATPGESKPKQTPSCDESEATTNPATRAVPAESAPPRVGASTNVVFRSAKGRSFAERKTTIATVISELIPTAPPTAPLDDPLGRDAP